MKKILILSLLLATGLFAYPLEGYSSEMMDSLYVRVKPIFQTGSFSEFYIHSLDSNRILSEEDSLTYSDTEFRTRLSIRVVRSVVFMAEIPYYMKKHENGGQEFSVSGVGDIDLLLKYRPVTSDNPVILFAGIRVPTAPLDGDMALGDDYMNLSLGVLNTLEKNGFELGTNLFIVLTGLGKNRSCFGNYVRYIGTAEAPVLLNGNRIGSITGEFDVFAGEELKKQYLINGKLGIEWRVFSSLRLQAGLKLPIISSDVFPKRGISPLVSLTFEI